jgi:hypothetical protein
LLDIRALGIGGNGVTQSVLFNPALLVQQTYKHVSVNYFNKYEVKELGTIGLNFIYPNSFLPVGFHISSFGYDEYRTTLFRMSVAKSLHEKWKIGLGFQCALLQTKIWEETPKELSIDMGALFIPVENLLIGVLIMNVPSFSIHKRYTDFKSIMCYSVQIGFQWKVINNLLIIGTLESEKTHVLVGNIGMEYRLFDDFYIRTGIQTAPFLPSLGIGYSLSAFTLDIATQLHPLLGMSMGIGLKYSF